MWNYMLKASPDDETIKKLKKYAKIGGFLFILLGLIGIAFPVVMSLTTVVLFSYLMLTMAVITGWTTYKSNPKDWLGWLKAVILAIVSLLMLFYPFEGIAAIGILFAVYFFVDTFANVSLAVELKGQKGWWIWILNAIASFALGVIFIVGWPFHSLVLVGLFVGVSFLFDGIALLMGSKAIEALMRNEK